MVTDPFDTLASPALTNRLAPWVSTKMLSAHHALCESHFGAKVVTTALRGSAQGKFRTFPGKSCFQKKNGIQSQI